MKTVNAIKKLQKSGFIVEQIGTGVYNRKFVAKSPGYRRFIKIYTQGGTPNDSGVVSVIDVRTPGHDDDIMTDYHGGTFCDTISQALRLVKY